MHDKPLATTPTYKTDMGSDPTEAKRLGNGPRPFMSHSGPSVESPLNRGQFSVRKDGRQK